MVQRAALTQRNPREVALGGFGSLANRLWDLARLAVTEADPPLLVADNHQRGKAEAPSTLHHLGHPIDVDERSMNSLSRSSRSDRALVWVHVP